MKLILKISTAVALAFMGCKSDLSESEIEGDWQFFQLPIGVQVDGKAYIRFLDGKEKLVWEKAGNFYFCPDHDRSYVFLQEDFSYMFMREALIAYMVFFENNSTYPPDTYLCFDDESYSKKSTNLRFISSCFLKDTITQEDNTQAIESAQVDCENDPFTVVKPEE